jgi:hypothetical protein
VVDQRVLGQPCRQIPAEKSARARDKHDLRVVDGVVCRTTLRIHPVSLATKRENYLPSFLRCTLVRRSSLRCFFFDIRLRRFLLTEPMNSAI